jgi:hypothetical protein
MFMMPTIPSVSASLANPAASTGSQLNTGTRSVSPCVYPRFAVYGVAYAGGGDACVALRVVMCEVRARACDGARRSLNNDRIVLF